MITGNGLLQILFYFFVIGILVKPLGWYIAQVYSGKLNKLTRILAPLEQTIYRFCHIQPQQEMTWQRYTLALLYLNAIGFIGLFILQKLQAILPLNPQHFPNIPTPLAVNVAISYITGTGWQNYAGESTMSYFTQMLGFTVQHFIATATGINILIVLIRGIARSETTHLGNFWVDTVRSIVYIFLPLASILAIILSAQGVIQNLKPYQAAQLIQPTHYIDTVAEKNINITQQIIPMGPVASQVAIKQLGSVGAGFFNASSAHPFENPTPISNFLELLAILLIPAALCYTYGLMVEDKRQGWALFITMSILFVPIIILTTTFEQHGNPFITVLGIENSPNMNYVGGNMEGKETRFGITSSAMWATAATATSNGSNNSMYDSFTPLGGMLLMGLMQIGEVVFGGIGSGLYSMLLLVIVTTFIAGLMIGRTPEYLGKKIEPFEMKMTAIGILIIPLLVLLPSAVAIVITAGKNAIHNPGPHGLSEILYAFTSMANNNGSAFAGLNSNTLFYNWLGSMSMLIGRFGIAIPVLAIAGALAKKKKLAATSGTLSTHTPLFIMLLIGVIITIGALTFLPVLILGPIAEQIT